MKSFQSDVVDYRVADRVATITLNRPDKLNAFDRQLRSDLLSAIRIAELDDEIRVIVFRGAGRGFCAGADLAEGLDMDVERMLVEEYRPFLMAIAESRKLCIAQVHGSAAGIGAALALVCDIMVMSGDAYVYLAFAAIGLIPDGGLTWHLVRTMGYRRAIETVIEGRKLTAETCLSLGIANEVVDADELDAVVHTRARKIAAGAPLAQSAAKAVMRTVADMDLDAAIRLEAKTQQPLTESQDCRDAVEAFFNKEKPVFQGK